MESVCDILLPLGVVALALSLGCLAFPQGLSGLSEFILLIHVPSPRFSLSTLLLIAAFAPPILARLFAARIEWRAWGLSTKYCKLACARFLRQLRSSRLYWPWRISAWRTRTGAIKRR